MTRSARDPLYRRHRDQQSREISHSHQIPSLLEERDSGLWGGLIEVISRSSILATFAIQCFQKNQHGLFANLEAKFSRLGALWNKSTRSG